MLTLSSINLISNYYSACIIDEVHLNNQRAKIFFDQYFKAEDKFSPKRLGVADVNASESFLLPNFLNIHRCKFIRFGEKPINRVLAHENNHYAKSVLF